MKKLCALALFFFLFFVTCASAETWRVFDNAGLLTDEEIDEIEQAIYQFQRDTNFDFAFLSTDDYLGKNSSRIAQAFYVAANLGFGQNASGVLYYLPTYDGKIKPTSICNGDMCDIFSADKRAEAHKPCDEFLMQGDYKSAILTMIALAQDAVNNAE